MNMCNIHNKADFDQIGSLIENKAILKYEFLKIYWHEVLNCWKVLSDDIIEIRKTLGDYNYMINFEKLKSYIEEFKNTRIHLLCCITLILVVDAGKIVNSNATFPLILYRWW